MGVPCRVFLTICPYTYKGYSMDDRLVVTLTEMHGSATFFAPPHLKYFAPSNHSPETQERNLHVGLQGWVAYMANFGISHPFHRRIQIPLKVLDSACRNFSFTYLAGWGFVFYRRDCEIPICRSHSSKKSQPDMSTKKSSISCSSKSLETANLRLKLWVFNYHRHLYIRQLLPFFSR